MKSFRAICLTLVLGLLLGLVTVPTAFGSVILPGNTGSAPDIFASCPGCFSVAGPVSSGSVSPNSHLTFSLTTAVIGGDTSNPFGSGDLDFVYQVANLACATPPCDSIGRVTATDFTGFQTDAGYFNFGGGTVAPSFVDRVTADVVGFGFVTTRITSGTTSFTLVVKTDATAYTAGIANIIDGGVKSLPAYAPAVPEPSLGWLLGGAMLAMAGFRRFRRSS
jgi:hypothetical protein